MIIGQAKIDFDALIIDSAAGRTTMEPIVMDLLKVLADNPNKVMSREDLITAVWGVGYGGDERLSRGISLLRKALGDKKAPRQYIETISRKGYRLIAAVRSEDVAIISGAAPALTSDVKIEEAQLTDTVQSDDVPLAVSINSSPPRRWGRTAAFLMVAAGVLSISVLAFRPAFSGGINSANNAAVEAASQATFEDGIDHILNYNRASAVQKAKDIFNDILAGDPDHAAARAGLSLAHIREYMSVQRDPALLQLAGAHAEAALRADEHLALANIAKAWSAEFKGELDVAHKHLDRADILDPNNKLSLEARVRVYNRQKRPDEARRAIDYAIQTYQDEALFYILKGRLISSWGEFEAAEFVFKRALQLTQNNSLLYAQLSHVLHMQDKTNEAVKVVQEGLKVSETALLYSNLGAYLFFQGHYDLAASAFEKTLEIDGDTHDFLYWSNLADAYRWIPGREDDAKIAYRRAIQLLKVRLDAFPDSSDLNTRLALYSAKLGAFEEAQKALSKVPFDEPLAPVQYYRSVVTYEIIADRKAALKFLGAALKAGYPLDEISNDPELTELRQDIAYHKLLAQQKDVP